MDLPSILERFGFPAFALTGFGVALWRVALWAAPRADRVVEAHLDFVATAKGEIRETRSEVSEIRNDLGELKEHVMSLSCRKSNSLK